MHAERPPPPRYLQMSGMILGGMIEGDSSMRRYEHHVRTQRMIARDRAMWRDLTDEDMPPAPSPSPPPPDAATAKK